MDLGIQDYDVVHEDLVKGRVRRRERLDDGLLGGPAAGNEGSVLFQFAAVLPAAITGFDGGEDADPEAGHVGHNVGWVSDLFGEEAVNAGDVADICADCVGEGGGVEDCVEEIAVGGGVGVFGAIGGVADLSIKRNAVD